MDTELAHHLMFGLLRGEIPERRMDALSVVVALDVAEQIPPCLLAGRPASLMNQFDLQRIEERLHWGNCRSSIPSGSWRPAHRSGRAPGHRPRPHRERIILEGVG